MEIWIQFDITIGAPQCFFIPKLKILDEQIIQVNTPYELS